MNSLAIRILFVLIYFSLDGRYHLWRVNAFSDNKNVLKSYQYINDIFSTGDSALTIMRGRYEQCRPILLSHRSCLKSSENFIDDTKSFLAMQSRRLNQTFSNFSRNRVSSRAYSKVVEGLLMNMFRQKKFQQELDKVFNCPFPREKLVCFLLFPVELLSFRDVCHNDNFLLCKNWPEIVHDGTVHHEIQEYKGSSSALYNTASKIMNGFILEVFRVLKLLSKIFSEVLRAPPRDTDFNDESISLYLSSIVKAELKLVEIMKFLVEIGEMEKVLGLGHDPDEMVMKELLNWFFNATRPHFDSKEFSNAAESLFEVKNISVFENVRTKLKYNRFPYDRRIVKLTKSLIPYYMSLKEEPKSGVDLMKMSVFGRSLSLENETRVEEVFKSLSVVRKILILDSILQKKYRCSLVSRVREFVASGPQSLGDVMKFCVPTNLTKIKDDFAILRDNSNSGFIDSLDRAGAWRLSNTEEHKDKLVQAVMMALFKVINELRHEIKQLPLVNGNEIQSDNDELTADDFDVDNVSNPFGIATPNHTMQHSKTNGNTSNLTSRTGQAVPVLAGPQEEDTKPTISEIVSRAGNINKDSREELSKKVKGMKYESLDASESINGNSTDSSGASKSGYHDNVTQDKIHLKNALENKISRHDVGTNASGSRLGIELSWTEAPSTKDLTGEEIEIFKLDKFTSPRTNHSEDLTVSDDVKYFDSPQTLSEDSSRNLKPVNHSFEFGTNSNSTDENYPSQDNNEDSGETLSIVESIVRRVLENGASIISDITNDTADLFALSPVKRENFTKSQDIYESKEIGEFYWEPIQRNRPDDLIESSPETPFSWRSTNMKNYSRENMNHANNDKDYSHGKLKLDVVAAVGNLSKSALGGGSAHGVEWNHGDRSRWNNVSSKSANKSGIELLLPSVNSSHSFHQADDVSKSTSVQPLSGPEGKYFHVTTESFGRITPLISERLDQNPALPEAAETLYTPSPDKTDSARSKFNTSVLGSLHGPGKSQRGEIQETRERGGVKEEKTEANSFSYGVKSLTQTSGQATSNQLNLGKSVVGTSSQRTFTQRYTADTEEPVRAVTKSGTLNSMVISTLPVSNGDVVTRIPPAGEHGNAIKYILSILPFGGNKKEEVEVSDLSAVPHVVDEKPESVEQYGTGVDSSSKDEIDIYGDDNTDVIDPEKNHNVDIQYSDIRSEEFPRPEQNKDQKFQYGRYSSEEQYRYSSEEDINAEDADYPLHGLYSRATTKLVGVSASTKPTMSGEGDRQMSTLGKLNVKSNSGQTSAPVTLNANPTVTTEASQWNTVDVSDLNDEPKESESDMNLQEGNSTLILTVCVFVAVITVASVLLYMYMTNQLGGSRSDDPNEVECQALPPDSLAIIAERRKSVQSETLAVLAERKKSLQLESSIRLANRCDALPQSEIKGVAPAETSALLVDKEISQQ